MQWLVAIALVVAHQSGQAAGAYPTEEAQCDGLDTSEQTVCLVYTSCAKVDDPARRESCISAAESLRESLGVPPILELVRANQRQTPDRPARGADVVIEESRPVRRPSYKPQPIEPDPVVRAPRQEDRGVRVTREAVQRDVFTIPSSFTGTVTGHQRLVRDKQLIVVDNQLIFEGDVAEESRLRVGDEVSIRRTATRLRSERYVIVGPLKRSIMARRVQCELIDRSAQTKARCAQIENNVADR